MNKSRFSWSGSLFFEMSLLQGYAKTYSQPSELCLYWQYRCLTKAHNDDCWIRGGALGLV